MKTYSEIDPRSLTIRKSGNENLGHKQFLDENLEPIVFQSDPCKIVAIKRDGSSTKKAGQQKLIIALDCGMDMETWFRTVQERLEGKFTNFRPFMERDLLVKADDKTMGFTSKKEFYPLSKLTVGDTVICILITTGVWSDEISSNLVWRIKQFVKL